MAPGAARRPSVAPVQHARHNSVLARSTTQNRISISSGLLKNCGLSIEGLLSAWPLLRSCSPGFAAALAERVEQQSFAPGQDIVESGCECLSLIFVIRGAVDVFVGDLKVGRIDARAYAGEAHVLGVEDRWNMTLRAEDPLAQHWPKEKAKVTEECTVGEIRQEDFLAACRAFPDMAEWLQAMRSLPRAVDTDCLLGRVRLFQGISDTTLNALSHSTTSRIFFPGEQLIQEDTPGCELLVLVRGRVTVEMAGRLVRTLDGNGAQEPVCLGELGLLGLEQVQSATVTAQSVCLVRVIFRNVFLKQLQEHGESIMAHQEVMELLQTGQEDRRGSVPAVESLLHATIFKDAGCSEEFLTFLASHLEEHVYLSDQTIMQEFQNDRCMYILTHGVAHVFERGRLVSKLKKGSVLGEMNLLGLASNRPRSVVAAEFCWVKVLHPSIVLRGLELFADERPKVLAAAKGTSGILGRLIPAKTDQEHRRSILATVSRAPFFEGMTAEFMDQLSTLAVDRIFMPGELIIEEAQKGNSMFIVVSGEASVWVDRRRDASRPALEGRRFDPQDSQKVQLLSCGSVFGELAMLGISPTRSATVQAETLCSLWEICQSKVVQFMADFPSFRRSFVSIITSHLEPTVSARLQSLPLFTDFDQQFRTLLSLSCKRRVCFPKQVIAAKGERKQGTLVINVGEARLEHANGISSTYSAGSYLGSEIMLGIQRLFSGTLTAVEVCHILVITHESYKMALQKYPSTSSADALVESTKRELAAFQAEVKRMKLQTFVMQRCSAALHIPETPHVHLRMFHGVLTQQVFRAWSALTKEESEHRRLQQVFVDKEQEWISRHVLVRKQRLLQEHLLEVQNRRFDWVTAAEWDDSTQLTDKRRRQPRLPRVAPIIGGPSLRSLGLAPETPPAAAQRMALPPI